MTIQQADPVRVGEIPEFSLVSRPENLPGWTEPSRPLFDTTADAILSLVGVPDSYRGWKAKDFPEIAPPAWNRGGICIRGNIGAGKSCLAAALLRTRLRSDHEKTLATERESTASSKFEIKSGAAKWMRCGEVLFAARGAFRDGGRSEESIICEAVAPRLLVLDDLCSGKTTDAGWTIISEIIARRVDWRRDTIVSTNLTLEEINQNEPRLASRLAAMESIVLKNDDRRLRKIS